MSLFSAVELAPRDPILGLNEQYVADANPNKVNLGVGMYYDDNGKLPLLRCVAAAEQAMVEAPSARGYLPIDGIAAYDRSAQRLAFGDASPAVAEQRIATVQALGGTGALKVAAELGRVQPTWAAKLARIEVLGEEDFRLHTDALPFPLLVTSGRVGPKVQRLVELLPDLSRRYPRIEAVDLRFSRRIVVQPARQSASPMGGTGA